MLEQLKNSVSKLTLVLYGIVFLLCMTSFFVSHNIYESAVAKHPLPPSEMELELEELRNLVEIKKEKVNEYKELIDFVNDENISLQNMIKILAYQGIKPQNYVKPSADLSQDAISRYRSMTYVGEWLGTAYTPSVEECGNDLGITASGKYIVPGYTIAVDPNYWNFGQKFYIEGIGIVEAMDTGSAIKGRERFDIGLFDRPTAFKFGRRTLRVWLLEEQ